MILKKRPAIRKAFAEFDYWRVAEFNNYDVHRLLLNPLIIRNRSKIVAIIHNARVLLRLHQVNLTLEKLTWRPVNYMPLDHLRRQGDKLDCTLFVQRFLVSFHARHFSRVGPKTLYSYLQAVGVVNDHEISCAFHDKVGENL